MTPQQRREMVQDRAWDWALFAERRFARLPFYRPDGPRAAGPDTLARRLYRWGEKSEKE
jgi:hypothetical protein